MCFSLYLGIGCWGGSPKGLVHNLLMQFFTIYSSKMEVFDTYFFDRVIYKACFSPYLCSYHTNPQRILYTSCGTSPTGGASPRFGYATPNWAQNTLNHDERCLFII